MFGFFKKKKQDINKGEKRKKQRRQTNNDRRDNIRWEPEKEDRRSGVERRKNINNWDGHDQ